MQLDESKFTLKQIKFLIALGSVVGLQTLSMTMLNPFINIYGDTLKWSTPFLCGLALGIYGLTNAVFQMPYGSLSDRIGRKPVIIIGLILLTIGLFLAYLAKNIYLLIASRALQGSGAIVAIAYSWISDGVEDNKKGRAMSIAGIIVSIGGVAAFIAGPLLYKIMPIRYMFLGSAVLILIALFYIYFFIDENNHVPNKEAVYFIVQMKSLLFQKKVMLLSICGFVNNYLCTEIFLIVPKEISKTIGVQNMWMIFLPAILCGIVAMKVTASITDKGYYSPVAAASFIITMLGWVVMIFHGIVFITIGTILNMTGFMCLTAGIPAQVNKIVSQKVRGAANGILQSLTYLGMFFGPTVMGFFIQVNLNMLNYIISIILALTACIISKQCDLLLDH